MANYDFKNYVDRSKLAASKWVDMTNRNPEVEAGIIPMSVADMDFLTCPEINQAIIDFITNNSLGYTRPNDDYLESVVKFFENYHGYKAKKEWIVTTPGIVSALATSVAAYTEEGDGVIIFTPIYKPFYQVIESQARKIIDCPLINKDNRYEIDFELLEELITQSRPKLLMLCSPHNPGGMVWAREDLLKIGHLAEKYDLLVVSDEIHSDISLGNHKHLVFSTINDDIGRRSIVCTAASKTFNIAGLQCSNIFIENEDLRKKFIEKNNGIGLERANILGMVASKAAYDKGLAWLDELKKVIADNHRIVKDFFQSYKGLFKPMEAEASFTQWVDFSGLKIDHEEFISFLDREALFFVTDGLSFGQAGRNFIRVNVGLPRHKLEENLERLKNALEKCYNI